MYAIQNLINFDFFSAPIYIINEYFCSDIVQTYFWINQILQFGYDKNRKIPFYSIKTSLIISFLGKRLLLGVLSNIICDQFLDFDYFSILFGLVSTTLCVQLRFDHTLCSTLGSTMFSTILCVRLCFDHTLILNLCSTMNRNSFLLCFDHVFDQRSCFWQRIFGQTPQPGLRASMCAQKDNWLLKC